eukprot:TRINITY_DN1303_c0_g1_i1.p1 TRINITY_DN1303_c0_g1~~TRINITY_DN1303_c0_g1_i1.p1  ORF type:complete len:412 (+),score=42.58 TRINITY_DN1303_c0_g1_i1:1-1236(+)
MAEDHADFYRNDIGSPWYEVAIIIAVVFITSKLTALTDWPEQLKSVALALGYLSALTASWTVLALLGLILAAAALTSTSHQSRKLQADIKSDFWLPFVAEFRGLCMTMTCIAILAVDFSIFPRRYAKTHVYGFSLMDLGIAMVVAGDGFRSAQHKQRRQRRPRVLLCAALGLLRFISVWLFNVNHHVGEYGLHWNFFLTIAVLALTTAVKLPWIHCAVGWLGLAATSHYQQQPHVEQWLISGARDNFFSANREGLLNVLAMYCIFWTVHASVPLLCTTSISDADRQSTCRSASSTRLLAAAIFSSALTVYSYSTLGPPSRRFGNVTYVIWSLAVIFSMAALLNVTCHVSNSWSLATSKALLPLFLVANVITGVVNMTIDTNSQSGFVAFILLLSYTCMVLNLPQLFIKFKI